MPPTLTLIITNPVSIVHNVHFTHDALLVDELNAAELAGVVSAQLLELIERVVVAVNLENEFCVQIFPIADIMDWIWVDLNPWVFCRVAEIVWNSVLDFSRAAFAVIKVLPHFWNLLRDAIFKIIL